MRALAVAGGIAVAAGVSLPANRQYVEPAAGEVAVLVANQGVVGGSTTTCQLPGSSRICRAWVFAVDDKITPWNGNSTRIAAGVHSVIVSCQSWSGGPMVFGRMVMTSTGYRGAFEATRQYFVHCVKQDGTPHAWLANSADGPPLPEFTAEPLKP
jgi:hypothetical protein